MRRNIYAQSYNIYAQSYNIYVQSYMLSSSAVITGVGRGPRPTPPPQKKKDFNDKFFYSISQNKLWLEINS